MALDAERYRAYIENSTEGIWRIEADEPIAVGLTENEQVDAFYRQGYLAECNDAFARMYGFAHADELIGTRLDNFLVREDPSNEEYLRAFICSGYRLENAESHELDRQGRLRYFSNSLQGVVENGFLLRAWGTQRDITAQHEAEYALRESEDRFRALADNIAQLAWMADGTGSIFWYNKRWFDYTGTTLDQMRGWDWQKVHHPDYVEAVTEKFRQHVAKEQVWEDTFPLRSKEGVYGWFLSRAFPIKNENNQVVLWCGTNTDVTEQREMAAKQRQFVREMLSSMTEGRLHLCETSLDLPEALPRVSEIVPLGRVSLRSLRHQAREAAQEAGLSLERQDDLITAVGEVSMNAVVHAGSGEGWICADRESGIVQVWVRDRGKGIAPDAIHKATLQRGYTTAGTLGHGFSMLLKTADRVYLLTGAEGTTVVLEQEKTPPDPAWLKEF